MDRRVLEAAYRMETAKTVDKAWASFMEGLAALSCTKAIYVTRSDGVTPDWHVRSSLPDNWPEPETRDPGFTEPFLEYCCATFEPSKLGPEFVVIHDGYIDEATRRYVDNMRRFDWPAALGIPCCLKGSGRYGGFIVGDNVRAEEFDRGVMRNADQLQAYCLMAHGAMGRLLSGAAEARGALPLSAREYQTLDLLSQGLRPKAIAETLGISEASVRLYLKNARAKLGAQTKEQAVAKFLALPKG